MAEDKDPLETVWEPRPIEEIVGDFEPIDLGKWSDEIDLSQWSDPLDLDALSTATPTPRKRREPGARKAATVLDQIVRETTRTRHPSSRFDSARICDALTAAATALRSGEDWRKAVTEVYSH